MADEPPPLDFSEDPSPEEGGKPEGDKKEEEEEDLFSPPEKPPEETQQQQQEEEEEEEEEEVPSKPAQLVVETEKEPPAEVEPDTTTAPPTLEAHAADESEDVVVQTKPVAPPETKTLDLFEEEEPKREEQQAHSKQEEEEEEEEGGDTFELDITVANPEKVGEGMSSYISYSIKTKTTMPDFKRPETTVRRRFSDFLGLHQRLSEKHIHKGRIVPPAPEKSMLGTTRIKFSKSEENSAFFIERRRAALERYLNRVGKHPVLRKDEYFREFLENPSDLPKATDTSAFSGAGFMRLMKNVGDSISKIGGKKSDSDRWFEEKEQDYEVLDGQLKKLHQALEVMISSRKELCTNTSTFVKSVATLGNVEENDSVSRALSRLSEVQEKVEALHQEQVNSDLYIFGETVKDYIALLASIKVTFSLRVKALNTWQGSQNTLAKKKETETKLQVGGKPEKLAQVQQEIKDWEVKVEEGQTNFDEVSKTLKREVERFEEERAQEFKSKFIAYLETLMHMQQELIQLWEGYLPDAQAIV